MTRRELIRPNEDVENQSKKLYASDDSSGSTCTLPTYEQIAGDPAALTSKNSKTSSGKSEEREQLPLMGCDERAANNGSQEHRRKKRRTIWSIILILGAVVLYSFLSRSFFWHFEPGVTPTWPESGSNDSAWPSVREIRVHETSHGIHGSYPLYDLLELSTVTGAIHVTIQPKSGNTTAVVRIKSQTGAIHIRFDKSASNDDASGIQNEKGIFDRIYSTQVDTVTGAIHADILHGGVGGGTVLSTETGLLDVRVTPIADHPSRIETSARTGLSRVVVEPPMHGYTLKNLTALHRSRATGMLDVHYPREWEGRVHAWCRGTGSVNVEGNGLNFQARGRNVYAWRGEGASKVGEIIEVVSEGTGMVEFRA